MKKELISVIVPVYKVERYINKCLDSIVNQTYSNLEILIIDDGSPDNCGKICDDYAEKDKRIKVFHIDNHGVSYARNYGIKYATGNLVSFLDSDDYIDNDFYEKIMIKYNESIDFYITNYKKVIKKQEQKCILKNNTNPLLKKEQLYKNILDDNNIGGYLWNKIYKLDIIKKNKIKFDIKIKIMEDLDFNLEYIKYINNAFIINNANYYYVQHSDSTLANANKVNNLYSMNKIINKIELYNKEFAIEYKLRFMIEYKKEIVLNHNTKVSKDISKMLVNKFKKEKVFFKSKNNRAKIKYIFISLFPYLFSNIYKIYKYVKKNNEISN